MLGRSRTAVLVVSGFAMMAAGCATVSIRNAVPNAEAAQRATVPGMPTVRFWGDEVPGDIVAEVRRRLPNMPRLAESTEREQGRPVVEYLALSGGGGDGAFGAGLLAGWTETGKRPRFEVVTGVSAGAVIAPFAFLGPKYDGYLRRIWTEYGTDDLVATRILGGLLGGPALADTSRFASLIAKYIDERVLDEVATEYQKGRILLVGTTNLDAQRPVIWNMGEIAASRHPDRVVLFRQVILASAAIPGAFPPVNIKVEVDGQTFEELHVDGGATREVFIAPVQLSLRSFDRFYSKPPIRRIFVIKNGKIDPEYEPVKPTTLSIASRAIFTLTKSQNQGDIYRIYRMAMDDKAEFRLAAVPDTFAAKAKEAFDKSYQTALFEEGYRLGHAGTVWQKAPHDIARSATGSGAPR